MVTVPASKSSLLPTGTRPSQLGLHEGFGIYHAFRQLIERLILFGFLVESGL
jgi:hypothetical protein